MTVMTTQAPKLTHAGARAVLDAAMARARELAVPQGAAVLDEGGHLLACSRMDGAPLPSVRAAQDKAFTALLGLPTEGLSAAVTAVPGLNEVMAGMERITLLGDGAPLLVEGRLVGAVGVGGGTPAQDVQCAQAGCAALERARG